MLKPWTLKHKMRVNMPVTLLDEIEGVIRGYIFIWGDPDHRDSYDTWFDKARPPELDMDLLPFAVRYEHGQDGVVRKDRIGEIFEVGFDDEGGYFLANLDKSSPYFGKFILEIQHGTPTGPLRTSSGTQDYLGDFYEDGAFKHWPIGEVSLTANASEPRMPDVELIRSERVLEVSESVEQTLPTDGEQAGKPGELPHDDPTKGIIMLEQIMAVLAGLPAEASLADVMAALLEAGFTAEELQEAVGLLGTPAEGEETLSEERSEIVPHVQFAEALAQVMDAKAIEKQAQEAQANRVRVRQLEAQVALQTTQNRMAAPPPVVVPKGDQTDGGNRITEMKDLRFDHLGAKQMALGYQLLRSKNKPISEGFGRALQQKAIDQLALGPGQFKVPSNYAAARSAVPYRANELMATATSLQGLDWVGDYWETQVWEVVHAARIMAAVEAAGLWIIEVPDGSSTAQVPLVGSDPIWYSAAENISVDATGQAAPLVDPSVAATAKVTVTPGKAMARVIVSTELIEDSIVPILSQVTRQFEESAADAIEYLFINADSATAASTNINLIDATPATGTNAPLYLVTDGVLKYALVTGSSTSRDGGVLTSGDFLATRKLLPDANAADPSKLVYISDISTMLKALELVDVKTQDVFKGATLENGVLAGIWGSAYLSSAQMALAYTAGKISTTAGNNTKGRLACVYPNYVAMVWKRQVTFKTEEDIDADVTKMVASLRVAFQARGAGASTVSYNLTV
jgi:hypothetical protein